jgi:zinc transporter ZupT
MRSNLLLALILLIAGFALCLSFFVLINVHVDLEPFKSWSELRYAGMFQFAGLVCLVGAILYLLMERLAPGD